jgi:hypothetical protein
MRVLLDCSGPMKCHSISSPASSQALLAVPAHSFRQRRAGPPHRLRHGTGRKCLADSQQAHAACPAGGGFGGTDALVTDAMACAMESLILLLVAQAGLSYNGG